MNIPAILQRLPLPALAALWSLAALGGALLSQYGFGFRPCDLCLMQRYPYAVIAVLGVAGTLLARRFPRLLLPLCLLLAALFMLDAGIAGYHVGVEQGWIDGPSACSGGAAVATIDELRAQIFGAALVSCKDASFVFLGLSMAAWNMLYALAGAGFLTYMRFKGKDLHAPTR